MVEIIINENPLKRKLVKELKSGDIFGHQGDIYICSKDYGDYGIRIKDGVSIDIDGSVEVELFQKVQIIITRFE